MTASPRPPREVVIGLDVGTTRVKAVAFGIGQEWQLAAVAEHAMQTPRPGWEVQDPDALLSAAAHALGECVSRLDGAEVVGVSVATAMHGLLGLDAGLRPRTALVTWADSRAADEARALRGEGGDELYRLTGVPVHPMTPLTKLRWFARHDAATWASVSWWVGLKDWVLLWLTGELVTERSSAAGTGMLDLHTGDWSPVALAAAGVEAARLPPVLPTTAVRPLAATAATRVALPAGTPVVVGAGDGLSANLGCGALAPGVAGLSIGTSGALRMALDAPRLDAAGTLFCYPLTDSVWVAGGPISNGGNVVRWAGRSLAPDLVGAAGAGTGDDALLALAATAPPGCEGLVMVPYLVAERSPSWDPDVPAAFLGLRPAHTRAHLARAAVEGVCLNVALVLDQLDRLAPVKSVRATGGAFGSALWREVAGALLDRPLQVLDGVEGTALGAAALGVFALGREPTLDAALASLCDVDAHLGAAEVPAPELLATYRSLRSSVPGLIAGLGRLAPFYGEPS